MPNPKKVDAIMKVLLPMEKLDLAKLLEAYAKG